MVGAHRTRRQDASPTLARCGQRFGRRDERLVAQVRRARTGAAHLQVTPAPAVDQAAHQPPVAFAGWSRKVAATAHAAQGVVQERGVGRLRRRRAAPVPARPYPATVNDDCASASIGLAEVEPARPEELRLPLGEDACVRRAGLGGRQAAQPRLQVGHGARRAGEEIAGDHHLADAVAPGLQPRRAQLPGAARGVAEYSGAVLAGASASAELVVPYCSS